MNANVKLQLRFVAAAGLVVLGAAITAAGLALANQAPADDLAKARQFLQQTPDELTADTGNVIHIRREIYTRYGPEASEISAVTGVSTENTTAETWMEVGSDGKLARMYARVMDGTGVTVQETVRQQGEERTIDPRTGAVLHEDSSPDTVEVLPLAGASAIEQMLLDGTMQIVSVSDTQLMVQRRAGLQHIASSQVQIPFFGDLSGVAGVEVVTLNSEGIVIESERYVETDDGQTILILSKRITAHEVLRSMPEGLF